MVRGKDSGYRPEIDGLRGIAILAVLLNHMDSRILSGGYVGVDIFFVISGFLITTIIRRDLDAGRFSFWHFYARRAKRLIPAATVMAITTLVLGYLFLFPRDFDALGKSVVAYSTMLSNVFFWRVSSNYWADQSKPWPLLHTWSLSIEEQFYLAYPVLLWGLAGLPLHRQRQILHVLLVASFVLCCWQTSVYQRAAYYLLPGRAWELLAGAACSMFGPAPKSRNACGLLGLAAIALIGVPMFLFNDATRFPGWVAILPVTGTALVIWVTGNTSGIWKTLLGWKPLTAIGKISYSLYLFHWPMLVFARYLWAGSPETPHMFPSYFAAIASLAVARLSYWYLETPGRSSRVGDKPAVALAFACGLLMFFVGYAVHYYRGLPGRLPPLVARYAQASLDLNPRRAEVNLDNSKITAGEFAHLGQDGPLDFVIWGDSHADALVPTFDHLSKEYGVAGTAFVRAGMCPLVNITTSSKYFDPDFASVVLDRLRKDRIPHIILAARWGWHFGRLMEDGRPVKNRERQMELFRSSLSQTISLLRTAGAKTIWLVRQVPTQNCNVPKELAINAWWGRYLPLPVPRAVTPDEHAVVMRDIDTLFDSFVAADIELIDLSSAVLANKTGLLTEHGQPMYYDHGHLSTSGAAALDWAFRPFFQNIAKEHLRVTPP